MGRESQMFCAKLPDKILEKRWLPYQVGVSWIRLKISLYLGQLHVQR